jgi:hypothetical protein
MGIMADINPCTVPLLETDLPQYDVVPDGALYLNELEGPVLQCFVSRYVNTDDPTIRRVFLGVMKNSLWESIRSLLATYPKDPKLDDRLALIKQTEFPQKEWTVGMEGNSESTIDNETTVEDGSPKRLDKNVVSSTAIGNFSFRTPVFQDWRASLGLSLHGLRNSEMQDTGTAQKEYTYFGHKLGASTGLRRADDSRTIGFSGSWDQRYDVSPDQLKQARSGSGAVMLRSKHYSLGGSANYSDSQNEAPPLSTGYLTQQTQSLTGQAEATARRASLGGILVYSYGNTDTTDHYSHDVSYGQSASLLAQYTRGNSAFRAGMGGGWTSGEFTLFNDPTLVRFEAGNVRWSLLAKHPLTPSVTVSGAANFRMNRSNGTFVGWYPSWDNTVAAGYSGKQLSLEFALLYEGYRIDLNQARDKNYLFTSVAASYRPWKSIKIKLSGEAKDSDVTGYKPVGNRNIKLKGSLGYTPNDYLWVGVYGGYYMGKYHFTGNNGDYNGAWLGGGASFYY